MQSPASCLGILASQCSGSSFVALPPPRAAPAHLPDTKAQHLAWRLDQLCVIHVPAEPAPCPTPPQPLYCPLPLPREPTVSVSHASETLSRFSTSLTHHEWTCRDTCVDTRVCMCVSVCTHLQGNPEGFARGLFSEEDKGGSTLTAHHLTQSWRDLLQKLNINRYFRSRYIFY